MSPQGVFFLAIVTTGLLIGVNVLIHVFNPVEPKPTYHGRKDTPSGITMSARAA